MDVIRRAIHDTLAADNPMTVRQVFYQLVSAGTIPKTQGAYKATVVRLLVEMRRAGEVPFGWIADSTRWMHKTRSHSSLEAAIAHTATAYRRALWDNQEDYVEVWCEKDALAGVLLEETDPWDVPLMVARGYASITYLYNAAQAIEAQGKPAYIYQLGDHDPSGIDAARKIELDLRGFAPRAEIHFERIAVTPEQIRAWDLPTRPTKASDSRASSFEGESVELDAIPPALLRGLVREVIERHVDDGAYQSLQVAEESERQILDMMTSPHLIAALRERVS